MQNITIFIKTHKLLVSLVLFFLIVIPLLISQSQKNKKTTQQNAVVPNIYIKQAPFHVITTSPKNNETNVYPGEILISITTDTDVLVENNLKLTFTPALPYYSKFTNSFPNHNLSAQVYGGLKPSTTYTVSILNTQSKEVVYTWTLTTSDTPAQDSSKYQVAQDQSYDQRYFPLLKHLPYQTDNFIIEYSAALTLTVHIFQNGSESPDQVKKDVIDWVKSKGVDPETHTINYIDNHPTGNP